MRNKEILQIINFKLKIIFLLSAFCFLLSVPLANAEIATNSATVATPTGASVTPLPGQYFLEISGYVSPFASLVLRSGSDVLATGVADKDGNFSFINISIPAGFTSFCIQAIDVKRIGESTTCFKVPAATGPVSRKNIFLPPTIGLSARRITQGASVFAFGYSMPGATVSVHIGGGKFVTVTADNTGFYKVEIKNLQAGTYELYATASLEKKNSEEPDSRISLEAVAKEGGLKEKPEGKFPWKLVGIILLLLILLLIILLIIYLMKRFRHRILDAGKGIFAKRKDNEKPLHHDWFV